MKNKKNGFSLFEFMLVLMVLLIVIVVSVPLILYAIKSFRINAFKDSAYSALESINYYIANNDFIKIPEEGISISELDLELDNNNFDDGLIKPLNDGNFEIVNLKKNNYCATGTINNMKATDSGCGALDETNPTNAYIYLVESTLDSLTLIAKGIDEDSEIVSYEFSIDGKKYTKASTSNSYVFNNLTSGIHNVIVRVTNEAGLTTTSEVYKFSTSLTQFITCEETNGELSYSSKKEFLCTYPYNENYSYQISEDGTNWNDITLTDNTYLFEFNQNKTMYTRVLDSDKIITSNTIKVENIDITLNGAYPELLEGMIPVIYDSNQNAWVKADPNKIYWDYDNKIWANSVLVRRYVDSDNSNSHSRSYYLSDEAIGQPITESDILGYFVWIPKYQYQIFNSSNREIEPQTISITFGDNIESHNAFNYSENNKGFWVAKFQTSTSKTSNCYLNSNKENCNIDNLSIYMLPNIKSLTNITISKSHELVSNMNQSNNIYGLDEQTNSHVITNLEWGAIAYLTNSIYGINKQITTNNQNYKNNLDNSTTGNITGVFDMVSNYQEFVMGNYNKDAGKDSSDNSGFTSFGKVSWPNTIDYYKGITYKSRILGDATGETINWYNSLSNFVNGEYPFFIRGGSSLYNFDHSTGNSSDNITFRVVLSKK